MRKVPVFLLAVCLTALLAGCAEQAVPLGGAQIGVLSATAVTSAAAADEKRDVPVSADAPDVENPADPAENVKTQENTQQPESKTDVPENPEPTGEEQPHYAGAAYHTRTGGDAYAAAGARTERIRTYTCAGTGAGAYTYPRT